GDGPQPLERDRPRTHLADTIGTGRQARLRRVDLGEHTTVAVLESLEVMASSGRCRIVQEIAWMMMLKPGELAAGHDERVIRLAPLAAKAPLELSDTPCCMTRHDARPPLPIETAGEARGLPGGTPAYYRLLLGLDGDRRPLCGRRLRQRH